MRRAPTNAVMTVLMAAVLTAGAVAVHAQAGDTVAHVVHVVQTGESLYRIAQELIRSEYLVHLRTEKRFALGYKLHRLAVADLGPDLRGHRLHAVLVFFIRPIDVEEFQPGPLRRHLVLARDALDHRLIEQMLAPAVGVERLEPFERAG